jgi:biopolymer transport protein ExbD
MPKLEPLSNGSSRAGGRRARAQRTTTSLAEINVVPLVDVMLVLLVIFMVAAPMMTQGFPVQLPQSRRSAAVDAPVVVTVPLTYRRDRRVQIDNDVIPVAVLATRVEQALSNRPRKSVLLAGDGGVTLQELMGVVDLIKEGGAESVNIQTQPPTGR